MASLDRFVQTERTFCIPKDSIRDLVVNSTWPILKNVSVPEGAIVSFFAEDFVVEYRVVRCEGFPSCRQALELVHGGFGHLVCTAKTVDEALVALHRVASHKGLSLSQALQEKITTEGTASALQWNSSLANSNDVLFVWQGEVVHVADLPVLNGKFLPSLFYAQFEDPRPGVMVIGMNYHDPSLLGHPDGLRMNILQQHAPFTHVWGISQERYTDSATWVQMDVRVGRGWRNALIKRRVLHTIIGMICPNWMPGQYLRSGTLGLGYGNKLFEITFANFFVPGKQKVFIMPNDSGHEFEEMARKYYSKYPSSHIKLVPLTPEEVYVLNPLFRATHKAQKRKEYNKTLAKAWRRSAGVEAFTGLDVQYPYILLYAGFDDSGSGIETVVSFLGRTCRNTSVVSRVPEEGSNEVGDLVSEEKDGFHTSCKISATKSSGSTMSECESTASSTEYCVVRQDLFLPLPFSSQPLNPSKECDMAVSSSSYKAQVCFHLLGEKVEGLPPDLTLKQILQVPDIQTLNLLDPWTWSMALLLLCPVPVRAFIQEYKAGRYVLQVGKVTQGVFFMVVCGQLLADPEERVWRELTEDSFTLLGVTGIIYGIELQSKDI